MSRIVVVSNRVPGPRDRSASAGGLVVALGDGLAPGSLWFGWSGRRSAEPGAPVVETQDGISYATVDLSEAEYRTYYSGFSNSSLYPLLLFRLGLLSYRSEDLDGYRAVNARFAAQLAPMLRPDDLVWLHDYHLLAMPAELRGQGVQNPIGMFIHTPFPPAGLFRVLPCADALLRALCAADVIGFQTGRDRDAFVDCATAIAGAQDGGEGTLLLAGHRLRTVVTPVGIDVAGFAAAATQASRELATRRLAASLGDRALAISVDRLDHTKGLPGRMKAVGRLLDRYPDHRRRVSFLQIAATSRQDVEEYQRLRRDMDRMVGDLNGRFGEADWTPMRYITRATRRSTIAGYHRLARVGVVTPLHDGMNLVAKEFVAAQREEDPGVLVLSEFAGAAEALGDALVVNPYDGDAVADAIHVALTMPRDERQARHRLLIDAVRRSDARAYSAAFLRHLAAARRRPVLEVAP